MPSSIALRSIDLDRILGRGGMGVVVAGQHRRTELPVAVKFLNSTDVQSDRQSDFRREVQAHAALRHPHIAYLFDYGQIPDDLPRDDLPIPANAHFVAMELAPLGTLADQAFVDDWPTLRLLLQQILDGLAYAHARSVIHRDLKPANLLLFPDPQDELPFLCKLTDFGLAHVFRDHVAESPQYLGTISGTPNYMAPEQAQAQWRRYGPWTDLYGLGCIAFELACGAPPFSDGSTLDRLHAHTSSDRPSMTPRFPVPDAFHHWVRRAISIAIDQRFQSAADAARALPEADTSGALGTPQPLEPSISTPKDARTTSAPIAPTLEAVLAGIGAPPESTPQPEPATPSPNPQPIAIPPIHFPDHWAPPSTHQLPTPLVDTGLGLFDLREPPFVNQDPGRDLIWKTLRQCHQRQHPHLVNLVGPLGAGRSRLAHWMATRARELGVAHSLGAIHTRSGRGPTEGLAGMVRRAFQGWNIGRGAFHDHLLDALPPLDNEDSFRNTDARALTELVFPTDGAEDFDGPGYHFANRRQRFAVLTRLLHRLARQRPVILILDDAQWNLEALQWTSFLLKYTSQPLPLLILQTLPETPLEDSSQLSDFQHQWQQSDAVQTYELTPLDANDHHRLIQHTLPLTDDAADLLFDRTEGHPLFTSQLLSNWIDAGALSAGDQGFHVHSQMADALPDDIHQLWWDRLDRAFAELPLYQRKPSRIALEMAAALGREFTTVEWFALCNEIDEASLRQLLEILTSRGLLKRQPGGVSFTHGLLVDSIEARARQRGRWTHHHRRCAQMLTSLYANRREYSAARRAAHLIAAGDLQDALTPLLEEQHRLRKLGDIPARLQVLDQRQQILDELQYPHDHHARLENQIGTLRCQLWSNTPPDEVLGQTDALLPLIDPDAHPLTYAWGLRLKALCHQHLHQYQACNEALDQSLEILSALGDPGPLSRQLQHQAWIAYLHRNHDRASRLIEQARPYVEQLNHRFVTLKWRQIRLLIDIATGDEEHPTASLQALLRECRQAGFRTLECRCLNHLGDHARFQGDSDTARKCYARYAEISVELHRHEPVATALLNSAQTELLDHHWEKARVFLDEFCELTEREHIILHDKAHELCRLTLWAGLGDWERFDSLLQKQQAPWPKDLPHFKDYPALMEVAADALAIHGETQRQHATLQVALRWWKRRGSSDDTARVQRSIDALSDALTDA